MTIKEKIDHIKYNLDTAYLKLQELKYDEEFEYYVRMNLLDTINITEGLLNSMYSQSIKERKNIKRQVNKR